MHLLAAANLILLLLLSPPQTGSENQTVPVIQFAKPDRSQTVYHYSLKTVGQMSIKPFNPDTLRKLHFTEEALGQKLFSELADDNETTTYNAKRLQKFIDNYYISYRGFYPKLTDITDKWHYKTSELWFKIEVNSDVMQGLRKIYIYKKSLFLALLRYKKNGGKITYPPGTIFISETYRLNKKAKADEFQNAEVMIKRDDDEWDFFLYDNYQRITRNPLPESKTDVSPYGCLSCHYAKIQHEPFKSFPKQASKKYYVKADADYYSREVFRFFEESRTKADHVMGTYASMFVSKLASDARQGKLSKEDRFIFDNLKPVLPEVLGK
jgi:hypothetical protein